MLGQQLGLAIVTIASKANSDKDFIDFICACKSWHQDFCNHQALCARARIESRLSRSNQKIVFDDEIEPWMKYCKGRRITVTSKKADSMHKYTFAKIEQFVNTFSVYKLHLPARRHNESLIFSSFGCALCVFPVQEICVYLSPHEFYNVNYLLSQAPFEIDMTIYKPFKSKGTANEIQFRDLNIDLYNNGILSITDEENYMEWVVKNI